MHSRDDEKHFELFDLAFVPAEEQRDKLIGQDAIAENLCAVGVVRRRRSPEQADSAPRAEWVGQIDDRSLHDAGARTLFTTDAGAMYRFHWVFPATKLASSKIGFREIRASISDSTSYAYLPDELVDARVANEVGDHPLFLIPSKTAGRCSKSLKPSLHTSFRNG